MYEYILYMGNKKKITHYNKIKLNEVIVIK